MFARFSILASAAILALAGSLAACAPVQPLSGPPPAEQYHDTSSLNPRAEGRRLTTACAGRDGWGDAAPPARIFGNSFYVGTCGISVILITSGQGHILIDGAVEAAVPAILANIRALGFDPRDIRFIVGSHEHGDHMGGFAALKAATGAQIWVREAARTVVETGEVDAADPQAGTIPQMTPVAVHAILRDGEPIRLGEAAITLTPHATPGHTSGGTSWTWQSCEGPNCATIAYIDSLTAPARDGYRFSDHPERVAPYRATFTALRSVPCDILLTPHPGVSNMFARMAGDAPLIDRDACRALVERSRTALDARLAREAREVGR